MKWIPAWRRKIERRYLALTEPVCGWLAALRVPPNAVSVAGLIMSIVSGGLYGSGWFFLGGIGVLLAGACDTIDGRLARQTGQASRFGSFLDSSLDRVGEIAIFSGLAFYFASGNPGTAGSGRPNATMVVLSVLALSGSLMVSYTRARAEGLSLECSIGLMQRPERLFVLITGSLAASLPVIGTTLLQITIGALAILSCYSAGQRIWHVYRQLSREKSRQDPGE